MKLTRPIIVIAADQDDARSALVARDMDTIVVTPRSRHGARGCRASVIVSTEAARRLDCYDDLLAATVPTIVVS